MGAGSAAPVATGGASGASAAQPASANERPSEASTVRRSSTALVKGAGAVWSGCARTVVLPPEPVDLSMEQRCERSVSGTHPNVVAPAATGNARNRGSWPSR